MTGRLLDLRRVKVDAVQRLAIDVLAFDLVSADGRRLPAFTAGAHIDVQVPDGPIRQYSLCGDPRQADRYRIAVKKEPNSRGGSAGMHRPVELGTYLSISGPRNHFPLVPGDHTSIFIAGGIGITPIRAMIQTLHAGHADWQLHYCARSEGHAAFYGELRELAADRVHAYFSETPILDVQALARDPPDNAHLYCCGPSGLMTAVAEATAHWQAGQVHFEWFTPPETDAGPNTTFEVELRRSNVVLQIPPDRSILQVLRENGFDVPSTCEEGVCGTCETRVLSGEPEHRDAILSQEKRCEGKSMMICVSRAKSERLVLDL